MTTPITNVSLEKLLKVGLLPKKDQITAMVVKKTKTKTRCINHRSNFQTLIFLLDNCRKGSPAVSAKAPQPHTHEQYQRLP